VCKARRALKASQVPPDRKGQKVILAMLARLGLKAQLVHRARKARKESPARLDPRVIPETLARWDHKAQPGRRVTPGHKDRKARRASQAKKAMPVTLVLRALQDRKAIPVRASICLARFPILPIYQLPQALATAT
jgi:hypothetical protein